MKKTFLLFLYLTSLIGCSSNPVVGEKEPLEAASICLEKYPEPPSDPFLRDGHLYTTLAITSISGYSDFRQMILSYYSQYPDIDHDYKGVDVAVKYLLIPWKKKWRNDITGILHSLHGGDYKAIKKRRDKIKKTLNLTLKDPKLDWLSGLVIHAYADSFSHTKNELNSVNEEAYNVWIGHLIPTLLGNNPDKIKDPENEPKYLAYITDLNKTIRRIDNDEEFDRFKLFVKNLKCEGKQCPNFHALSNNESTTEESRVDNIIKCMNSTSRQLTEMEVQRAMDLIYTDSDD